MKRKILIIFLLGIFINTTNADGLKAYLSYAAFNTPENVPYLETYLTVKGSSVKHVVNEKGLYQGTVEVQIIFRKNDSIVNFAKYELSGPKITDTLTGVLNFLDVQRYSLGNGDFDIEFKINDKNTIDEPIMSFDQYAIDFPETDNYFSDIELLQSFEKSEDHNNLTRNGYHLTPYIFNYYPANTSKISFYTELYNNKITEDNESFLLSYYLRPFKINTKMEKFSFISRKNAETVNPLMATIDISDLPSGNYFLVMEARNKNNEIIASKETFFQRYNPAVKLNITDIYTLDPTNTFVKELNSHDTLAMFISWLKPISTDVERAFSQSLLKPDANIDEMQKYFLNFWSVRNSAKPLDAWMEYKINAERVNNTYKTQNTPGYDTDRGRVYLQYGVPNSISQSYNEPNAFPYEIWHYYQLPDNQRNKKFVFYTQEFATNDFELIHSDAIGELNNYKWRIWINSRDTRYTNLMNVDDGHYREIWGSSQDDYYNNPR
jgi:GWxTD domain-containing protein